MQGLRVFLLGVVVGGGLTAAGFVLFGDDVRESVSTATERVGESVKKVGETIEEKGGDLR